MDACKVCIIYIFFLLTMKERYITIYATRSKFLNYVKLLTFEQKQAINDNSLVISRHYLRLQSAVSIRSQLIGQNIISCCKWVLGKLVLSVFKRLLQKSLDGLYTANRTGMGDNYFCKRLYLIMNRIRTMDLNLQSIKCDTVLTVV